MNVNRQLLIDCRELLAGVAFEGTRAHEVLARIDAALAAQHTAAEWPPKQPIHIAWLRYVNGDEGSCWLELCDSAADGAFKVFRGQPEPPSSLTGGQGKVTITQKMIESAARAICKAMQLDPDCLRAGTGPDGGIDGEVVIADEPAFAYASWRKKAHLARAAIEAVADQLAGMTDKQLLIDCREVISRIYPKAVLIERINEAMKQGEVVVTTTSDGRCVAVTRQDDDHRILSVIWEAKPKAQIVEEMARRFLGWRIPDSFSPDCYVMFDRERAKANNSWPIGTNIFSLDEAMKMVNYLLDEADQLAGGGK